MGALLSIRAMMEEQKKRCCGTGLPLEVVGFAVYTDDGQRIGVVDDLLVDDEEFITRLLVVNTSSAEFIVNQPRVLLPAPICCWDAAKKTLQTRATVSQVQSAPAFDRGIALSRSYEDTIIFHYGERPFAPADT